MSESTAPSPGPIPTDALVRTHIVAGVVWLLIGMLGGLLTAYRVTSPGAASFMGEIPQLSYGRVRMFHTHAVNFGWMTNLLFAFAFYAVPRLAGRALYLGKVARANSVLFQLVVTAGGVGILAGFAEGVEFAEAPWWADIGTALSFVLALVSIVGTILKSGPRAMYVSLWYCLLGFLFTALNFTMANTIVAHVAPGAAGAALEGLWIHNIVGLWVTPLGTAMVYYLLPVLVEKPIASHRLSLIGFWTLAIFYPLGGSHHFFYSPIPSWLQTLAVAFTCTLIFVVYTVVYNFFATMRGQWSRLADSMALRFLTVGIFAYLAVCTQGPFQALLSVQAVTHFTDWVVAHAHLALFSVFSFWNYAFVYFAWPRITGRDIRSRALAEWHFWLSVLGFFLLYFIPDTMAGLIQGFSWLSGAMFIESVKAATPFWISRAVSGVVLILSVVLFAINLVGGPPVASAKPEEATGE